MYVRAFYIIYNLSWLLIMLLRLEELNYPLDVFLFHFGHLGDLEINKNNTFSGF